MKSLGSQKNLCGSILMKFGILSRFFAEFSNLSFYWDFLMKFFILSWFCDKICHYCDFLTKFFILLGFFLMKFAIYSWSFNEICCFITTFLTKSAFLSQFFSKISRFISMFLQNLSFLKNFLTKFNAFSFNEIRIASHNLLMKFGLFFAIFWWNLLFFWYFLIFYKICHFFFVILWWNLCFFLLSFDAIWAFSIIF